MQKTKQFAFFTVVSQNLEYTCGTWDPYIKILTTLGQYNDVQQRIKNKIDFKVKEIEFKSS